MAVRYVKVIVAGDGAVGKTALVTKFTTGRLSDPESYKMTIGVNIATYRNERNGNQICLAIWDVAGQQRFDAIRKQFYVGAQIVVFVFDVTNRGSFKNLTNWLDEVHKSVKPSNYKGFIVGNKIDLNNFRVVGVDEAKAFAETMGFDYIETSVMDNSGISKLVEMLTDSVVMHSPHTLVEQIEAAS